MSPPIRFRADLEGLRGAAILLVVLFHASVPGFAGGFVGVDVFFVLSGYFITAAIARELETSGRLDLNEFWGRRMLRLSPPLLVVLMATLAIAMTLYAPIDRSEVAGFARYVAVYAGNIDLANRSRDYFSSNDNPLLHTWSLGVEEQFYLLWPLVLILPGALWANRSRTWIVAVLLAFGASLVASLALTESSQPSAFYGVFTRVWEFALGGLIAFCHPESYVAGAPQDRLREGKTLSFAALRMTAWLGCAALILALVMFDDGTQYPGAAALLPALGAAAIIAGNASWFDLPPLRWLGRVSYSWYLWHWPLVGLGVVLHPGLGPAGKVAWSLVALGFARLTYRFVEGSAREGRLSSISTDRLALYGVMASLVAVGIAWTALSVANRQAAMEAQARFAAARHDRFTTSCWSNTLDDYKPCIAGDPQSATTIALLGDSHAEHWLGALDRAGKERGWKIDAMVKGGCPVSDAPEMTHPRRIRHYRECARFRTAMLDRIVRERPAAVILSSWDHYIAAGDRASSWKVTPEQWEAGLRRTYTRLAGAGIQVIVMRDVPTTPFNVPQCLSRQAAGLPFAGPCSYDRAKSIHWDGRQAQDRAVLGLPVAFVDMNDVICPRSRCSPVQNGHIVFTDDNHITASFSRSVGDILGARIMAVSGR